MTLRAENQSRDMIKEMKKKSVLVIFSGNLPKKSRKWWQQFETLIAPKQLKGIEEKHGLHFIDIDNLIDSGSIKEATELTRKLSLQKDSNGRRISKIENYKGFELWWTNYDSLMYNFCLPYTQYRRLLEYLINFSKICIYKPPFSNLFNYFLSSHNCQYVIKNKIRFKRKLPLGILLQVFLSIPFLLWIKLRRPQLMLWTSDKFDKPRDYDFRMKFIYDELYKKKINFVEFIRSIEKPSVALQHALKRRRPVVYSYAIATLMRSLASIFSGKNKYKASNFFLDTRINADKRFWFFVATNYLHNIKGDIWAIQAIKFILKFIGIKVSIIDAAVNSSFPEVISCKLIGIPTIGIQHGASSKNYFISDFMHEFDGEKQLSVDKYGLWSDWWKEYFLKNSKAYRKDQLFVSGPMRPIEIVNQNVTKNQEAYIGPIKILLISEQQAVPNEIFPYLEALLQLPRADFVLAFRFRSYRDGFRDWLTKNRPDFLKQNDITISEGGLQDAVRNSDIVVGSNSTAVLEALFQYRVPILFKTQKWGDCFELRNYCKGHPFFAENPDELIEKIKNARTISYNNLNKLRERFFGDPYRNGSRWVVEEAENIILKEDSKK